MPDIKDLLIESTRDEYSSLILKDNDYENAWNAFGEYEKDLDNPQANKLFDIINEIAHAGETYYYKRGLQDGAELQAFLNKNNIDENMWRQIMADFRNFDFNRLMADAAALAENYAELNRKCQAISDRADKTMAEMEQFMAGTTILAEAA